jgi:hypothetical protein
VVTARVVLLLSWAVVNDLGPHPCMYALILLGYCALHLPVHPDFIKSWPNQVTTHAIARAL